MKWKLKERPKEFSVREISKYLYCPKKIKTEVRWLEKATIKQMCFYDHLGLYNWIDFEFVD